MAITIHCPCGKRLKTRDENAGKRARCPVCESILPIPEHPDERAFDIELGSESALPTTWPDPPPIRMRFGPTPAPADEYELGPRPEPPRLPVPGLEPADDQELEPSAPLSARPPPAADVGGSRVREYAYLFLALALIPLAFSLASKQDDLKERLARSLQVPVDEVEKVVDQTPMTELLAPLPGNRIEGALLPHDSAAHWLFAGMSATAFLSLLLVMFPRGDDTQPVLLLAVGLFTSTLGILFLLLVQWAADSALQLRFEGKGLILWLVLAFIGFSYRAALNPSNGFIISALGFTFGVGLCEELCKALPLLWIYRRSASMTWRQACLWGLASGIGFGVSEGIMYSGSHYNGLHGGGIYLVRFVSCVALHAVWGASVGMVLDRKQELLQGEVDLHIYAFSLLRILAVPMVLHGLYDTFLKKELRFEALLAALASFAWFAWQIESARLAERAAHRSTHEAWA